MSEKNGKPAAKPDVDTLRAGIKQTRAELGETVQALAAKADVKARAREQVEQAKERVRAQAAEATSKVRGAADRVRSAAGQTAAHVAEEAREIRESEPVDGDVTVGGRRLPVGLMIAGVAAVVGIILVMRSRRR